MYCYSINSGGEKRTGRECSEVMYMCLMHEAGAALPIFARKRPRVALMAFSNSQNTNSEHTSQHHRQDKSIVAVTRGQNKENTAGGYGGKETTTWR